MGGAARSRGDEFDAALFGSGRVFKQEIGRAMRRDNACFMWNTEFVESFGGEFHGVPVRAGAHDDADEWVSGRFELCFGSHGVSSTVRARYIVPLLVDKLAPFIFDHRA